MKTGASSCGHVGRSLIFDSTLIPRRARMRSSCLAGQIGRCRQRSIARPARQANLTKPNSYALANPKVACGASTATRLCNQAQGWTEGTTPGAGHGGTVNPNGVVAGGITRDWFSGRWATTPLGLADITARLPRVGAAPTLGFVAQPRWGWNLPPRSAHPKWAVS